MRGSTRKRGTSWTAYWDLPADPTTGNRRQASKGGFRTQKDAQRYLANVVVRVADGIYVEPSKQPLAAFMLGEWLPAIEATVRPSTHAAYRQACERVKRSDVSAVPLRSLNGGHLNAFYREMEQAGLSIATRRLTHTAIHRALRDAVRWDKLARNPAASADPPAIPPTRVESWTPHELRRFLAHVADDRLAGMWRLAATTGMRRGELLGLPWLSLDLEGATLRVERQLLPSSDYGPPKSKRGVRTIHLDEGTVVALRRHREIQRLERDLAGPAYEDGDLVFCDELGRPYRPGTISERFVRYRKAAGISVGSIHVLRHTSATIALTAGVPLHVVAARLGDDPTTVLSVYSHLLPHSDVMAADAVAAAIVDKPWTGAAVMAAETVN